MKERIDEIEVSREFSKAEYLHTKALELRAIMKFRNCTIPELIDALKEVEKEKWS